MSRAKSMDVLSPNQQFLPTVCPVNNNDSIDTDLLVNQCSLSSRLHSQADHSLTSQTSYQQKLLSKHTQSPSDICENERITYLGVHGVRSRSKSHEAIVIDNQTPILPSCKISQQYSTSHHRSSSFQEVSFAESSCNSFTQIRCSKDDFVLPLVKKQNSSFKMSDLLVQCKAESVPNKLHQEELPLINNSTTIPNRCRFGKREATIICVKV